MHARTMSKEFTVKMMLLDRMEDIWEFISVKKVEARAGSVKKVEFILRVASFVYMAVTE
jgi:hypothetical protein